MNKATILILVSVLHACAIQAQNNKADSLKKIIAKTSDEFTKGNACVALSYELLYVSFEEGVKYANQAIDIGFKLKNDTLLAFGYNRKAAHYAAQRQDSLAFAFMDKALELFLKSKHPIGQGYTYFLIGWLSVEKADYKKAITVLNSALKAYDEANEIKMKGVVYNSLGIAYYEMGDYHSALNAYFQYLKTNEPYATPTSKGISYGNIALVYNQLKEYDKALEHYSMAQKEYEKTTETSRLIDNYGHIANAYDNLNNFKKALENYNIAEAMAHTSKYEKGLNNVLLNRSLIYIKEKRFTEARPDVESALVYFLRIEHPQSSSIALQTISEMYRNWPDSLMSSHELTRRSTNLLAKNSAYSAVHFAKLSDNKLTLLNSCENLAKTLETLRMKDSSLIAYKEFIELYKTVSEEDIANKNATIKLSAAFDAEQRETIIRAETDKQRTIKTASIIVGSALLLLAVMIFIHYKKRRDTKAKELIAQFNTVVAETEMKALRSQMNPHFIFNSLNSISLYIQKNELKLADSYLVKFARLMRLILENSEHKEVTIKKDMEALELYIQLEQVRLKNSFSYTIKIDKTIDAECTLIPPLLLQPFVENSIWHGISTIPNGCISIEFVQYENRLRCIVDDNGIGRKKLDQLKKEGQEHQSLGLKITRSRIEILNKTKQAKSAIHIFDKEHGTRIETELPLELNY